MTTRLIILDESKQRRHGILSVGGVVIDISALAEVEDRWQRARLEVGIEPETALKYSMKWPGGPEQRRQLLATIGELPLQAVVALLEDFRPRGMTARKATRNDAYVQCRAFEWTLQRLAGQLYIPLGESGPHLLMMDGRDDFSDFHEVYVHSYSHGWPHMPYHPIPPLRERGFSASLGECSNGPVHEIADLVTSCMTRWADQRCVDHKGGSAPDLAELDSCVATLLELFPTASNGVPPRRCGHSIVAHAGNRTGKELLHNNLDRWAYGLRSGPSPGSSPNHPEEVPF